MATGFPVKANYATGDVLTAANMNDLAGTLNYLNGVPYNKNAVINGGFDIWQRGTSFTPSAATGTYTADRWQVYRNVANYTVSRQATSDTTNLPFIQYCMRLQRTATTTNTDTLYLLTSLETTNSIPFAGKTITISFYARAGANFSATSGAFKLDFQYGTGTDQNLLNGYTGGTGWSTQTSTLTTTWQRFTYTGTVPSTATEMGMQFSYVPVGTAGAADYVEITGVQLELGSSATPFSRAGGTIQGELAACQRYYWRTNSASDGSSAFGLGIGSSSTGADIVVKNPVTMRIAPTSLDYAGLRIYDIATATTVTAAVINGAGVDNSRLGITVASGLTQYRPYELIGNSGSSYVGFSAEL